MALPNSRMSLMLAAARRRFFLKGMALNHYASLTNRQCLSRKALCVPRQHSAKPRDILSLRSVYHGNIYVLHQQVTKLCHLDWEHQPAALAAPGAQHPRRCHSRQVVRLSPTGGLKGHQDKMKYSCLFCATCCAHWPSIRFLLEMVVKGNRRPPQTGNDTSARTPFLGLP